MASTRILADDVAAARRPRPCAPPISAGALVTLTSMMFMTPMPPPTGPEPIGDGNQPDEAGDVVELLDDLSVRGMANRLRRPVDRRRMRRMTPSTS